MTDAILRHTRAELAHWRLAAEALLDLDDAASPEAWAGLEAYLQCSIRDRLTAVASSVVHEARALERRAADGQNSDAVRRGVLALRRRYLQVETIIDYFGDAINSRTSPSLRALLRGFDVLAGDSMATMLTPLGITAPPALVYVDKGLGAAILRAGIRLWDEAHPSPAAAIKLTRHNLSYPTALCHETGHQAAHLTGWNTELAEQLHTVLEPRSADAAELWASWAPEIAADLLAFAQAGWAPVFALANVIDGPTPEVFRIRLGDPHPFAWVRVMFNVALCRSWFGHGPWDAVGQAWWHRHPLQSAPEEAREIAKVSVEAFGDLVDACTRRPFRAFRGAPLAGVLDPRKVSPDALRDLEQQAGGTLLTSSYLWRRHAVAILAILSTRAVLDPENAAEHRRVLAGWIRRLGAEAAPLQLPSPRVA